MEFTYEKTTDKLSGVTTEPKTIHRIKLKDSDFQFIASEKGFKLYGETPWFQPESGEVHLPVELFREFMTRLSLAASLAWKEQKKAKRDELGRKAMLEL